ncbi:MAG: hypothetical protein M0R17_07465 [Candidatus Omnitrophica bacterium]|jgi:hypothetical protein|nr:hypothetical protein [Candidatus Omnitrophota bacterium]
MACIDKIYGTQKQYLELLHWLMVNQKPIKCKTGFHVDETKTETPIYSLVLPTDCLYDKFGYNKNDRPIANFPENIDKWLLKNCPIKWVVIRIKEQYSIK